MKSIGLKQSTPEEVAELNANMASIGLKPGEVGEMLAVNREISGEPGGVRGVRERIALDKKLRDKDITQEVQLDLQEKCKRYGGLGGVLEGLEGYMKLEDIKRETEETRMLLSDLKVELKDVEDKINKSRDANEALVQLYIMGWTPMSLMALPRWLRESDTSDGVKEALRGTHSIMDLREAEKRAQSDLDQVKGYLETAKAELVDKNDIISSIIRLHANGWDDAALARVPSLLKEGETPERYEKILEGVRSLEEVEGRIRDSMVVLEKMNREAEVMRAELDEIAGAFKEGGVLSDLKAYSLEDLRDLIEVYASVGAPFLSTRDLAEVVNRLFVRFWTRVEANPNLSKELRELAQKLIPTLDIIDPKRTPKVDDNQRLAEDNFS